MTHGQAPAAAPSAADQVPQSLFEEAVQRKEQGQTDLEIGSFLMRQGLDHATAEAVVAKLPDTPANQERRARKRKDLTIGAVALAAAVVLTAVSYDGSSHSSFRAPIGLLLFGMWKLSAGLAAPR